MNSFRGVVGLLLLGLWLIGSAQTPRIAIVMDDLGYQYTLDQAIMALDARVTIAIIPEAPGAGRLARQAGTQGREVLIHLPLAGIHEDNCEPALTCMGLDWSAEKMTHHLFDALARVEGAVGINNHQGSRFTRDSGAVSGLVDGLVKLKQVHDRSLFVLDSRTVPDSLLEEKALAAGLAATRRHVFLDHFSDPDSIEHAWEQLQRMARSRGFAIAIGHPRRETLEFLKQALPALEQEGFQLVPVSELTRQRTLMVGPVAPGETPPYPASR